MRTAASSVHISSSDRAVAGPHVDPLLDLLVASYGHRAHAKHSDTQFGMLLHVKATLRSLRGLDQEILDDLIVYLDHAQGDLVLDVVLWLRLPLVDAAEDLLARPGDDALVASVANDGVGFARAGLAIGEEAGVISIEGIIEDFLTLF